MRERREGFWPDIRDIVVAVAVLMLIYSVGIFYFFRGEFIGWLNTLFATLISVVFALIIGLILYHYQDRRADQGKKESLSRLLKAELTEVRNLIQNEKTVVPDDALEAATRRTPGQLETRVSLHYVHPLIVEEAIRSGLFNERQTAEMLSLARNMRAHSLRVEDFTARWWHLRDVQATSEQPFSEAYEAASRGHAETGRSVQKSEDRVLEGCTRLLASLESG